MEEGKTNRGFKIIEFKDQKGVECSIQESSSYYPCLWIGVNNANPQIMAHDSIKLGIPTVARNGWVPYKVPKEVLMSTRMHLDKEGLREFIDTLEEYYSEMPDMEE